MRVVRRTHSELCRNQEVEVGMGLKEHPGLFYSAISFTSLLSIVLGRVQRYCALETMSGKRVFIDPERKQYMNNRRMYYANV